jgi:hypothetical protein
VEKLGFYFRNFLEIFGVFFENLSRKFKFHENLTRIMGTAHQDQFLTVCRLILLRIRNVSYRSCGENQNTHFMLSNVFYRAFYEIMWKYFVVPVRPQMTIKRMRIACWIPMATNTNSHYVTHCFATATIVARTRLIVTSLLHELASLLRHTCQFNTTPFFVN